MDLRKSKYIIPNSFTLTSAFLGLMAVIWAAGGTDGDMKKAVVAIVIAMLADTMDGKMARLTNTQSRFGVQMDSLADAISFGLAPAAVAYLYGVGQVTWGGVPVGLIGVFIYMAAGIMRLARFNLGAETNKKPAKFFEGLPIPGGAGAVATFLWVSLDLGMPRAETAVILTLVMPLLGILMISRVPYISLKHVKWAWYKRAGAVLAATVLILIAIKTKTSFVLLSVAVLYIVFCPLRAGVGLFAHKLSGPDTEEDPEETLDG